MSSPTRKRKPSQKMLEAAEDNKAVDEALNKKVASPPAKPEPAQPKHATPKAVAAKQNTPKAAAPKAGTPKVGTPKAVTGKAGTPKTPVPVKAAGKKGTPASAKQKVSLFAFVCQNFWATFKIYCDQSKVQNQISVQRNGEKVLRMH